MTEREALIQLATPEPDYPVETAEWQEWRDQTTAALNLARALPVSSGHTFESLRAGRFPFDELSSYDVRVALLAALGILDDNGLLDEFAQAAEEEIVEARAQAMEP